MANQSEFWEAYKDPRWQRKRLECMQAADFTCQNCGSTDKTLNVHHKRYVRGRKPWEYELAELLCYCGDCHKDHHAMMDELNSFIAKLDIGDFDQLLGYAKGLYLRYGGGENHTEQIAVRSYEDASGIADAYGIRGNEGIDKIIRAEKNGINHATLTQIARDQV